MPNQLLLPLRILPIPGINTRVKRIKQISKIKLALLCNISIFILEITNIKNKPIIKKALCALTYLNGSSYLYSAQIELAEYIITIPNIAIIITAISNNLSYLFFM